MRFYSDFFRIALIFIMLPGFAPAAFSNQEKLAINIHGHSYQAVMRENLRLKERMSGISQHHEAKHYTGVLSGIANSWLRVSLIGGQWQGVVSLHGSMYIIQQQAAAGADRAMTDNGMARSSLRLNTTPAAGMTGACGTGDKAHSILSHVDAFKARHHAGGAAAVSAPAPKFSRFCQSQVNGICVIAEVEIAFDDHFETLFGAQARASAAAIINIVDGHYKNDLKVSIDAITVKMNVTEFSSTTSAGGLLRDMQAKKNAGTISFVKNNRAVTHLVTGRKLDKKLLGVAYIASVCKADGANTSVSSVVAARSDEKTTPILPLTAIVVAHELAHNFGSHHDGQKTSKDCPANNLNYIMLPSFSPLAKNFSSCSVRVIQSALAGLPGPAQCLDFPADLEMKENARNSGMLSSEKSFTSAFTVGVKNGFLPVRQIQIKGAMNTAEAAFMSATANGQACNVASDGRSYTCDVANPDTQVALLPRVKAAPALTSVSFTHTVSPQTADVQDTNLSNNSFVSTFKIKGNRYASTAPGNIDLDKITDTGTAAGSDNKSGGGGGGAFDYGFILLLALVYVSCFRSPRSLHPSGGGPT